MKYLKNTAKWLQQQSTGTAIFTASTWTLAWCYFVSSHPKTGTIVACPVLLSGLTIIARSTIGR
jgi:hypothetical protein